VKIDQGSNTKACIVTSDEWMTSRFQMTEKRSKELTGEAQCGEFMHVMERGDESAKTKCAYFNLSGLGGAEVDADEAVV